jgi:hypothetical protein
MVGEASLVEKPPAAPPHSAFVVEVPAAAGEPWPPIAPTAWVIPPTDPPACPKPPFAVPRLPKLLAPPLPLAAPPTPATTATRSGTMIASSIRVRTAPPPPPIPPKDGLVVSPGPPPAPAPTTITSMAVQPFGFVHWNVEVTPCCGMYFFRSNGVRNRLRPRGCPRTPFIGRSPPRSHRRPRHHSRQGCCSTFRRHRHRQPQARLCPRRRRHHRSCSGRRRHRPVRNTGRDSLSRQILVRQPALFLHRRHYLQCKCRSTLRLCRLRRHPCSSFRPRRLLRGQRGSSCRQRRW